MTRINVRAAITPVPFGCCSTSKARLQFMVVYDADYVTRDGRVVIDEPDGTRPAIASPSAIGSISTTRSPCSSTPPASCSTAPASTRARWMASSSPPRLASRRPAWMPCWSIVWACGVMLDPSDASYGLPTGNRHPALAGREWMSRPARQSLRRRDCHVQPLVAGKCTDNVVVLGGCRA